MQQSHDIKARYPHTILFFRMGDFYEMFEDDARLAGRESGVVLEHFVEIAHAEKQDGVRIPRLDVVGLLHEGGIGLGPRRHGSSTTNGWPPRRVLIRRCACWASSRVA